MALCISPFLYTSIPRVGLSFLGHNHIYLDSKGNLDQNYANHILTTRIHSNERQG